MFDHNLPKVPQVSAEILKKAIDNQEKIYILDVRTPQELERGKIKNCINIPVAEIRQRIEKEVPDKKSKIYAYCLSGTRSAVAVAELIKMGYTDVYSVISGLLSWRIQKYPLE
jgi:rhodanese-related sulfurtransferase